MPVYWPGGVRHEGGASLICGSCMERGKAGVDTARPRRVAWVGERERAERREPEALSTDAALAGGPARSSGEAPVMGVERRGRLILRFVRTSNRGTKVLAGGDEWASRVRKTSRLTFRSNWCGRPIQTSQG